LDCTTVMITSEFTRTPGLTASNGKNHNPQCNSVILMGPGLKPGMYGSSRLITAKSSPMGISYLAGMPLDLTTFEPVERADNAFILRPDMVIATLAQSMGCSPAKISDGLGKVPVLKTALR
jgi:hypothetical protein